MRDLPGNVSTWGWRRWYVQHSHSSSFSTILYTRFILNVRDVRNEERALDSWVELSEIRDTSVFAEATSEPYVDMQQQIDDPSARIRDNER